jgi:tRNA-specific 2-thiouridylase
MSRIAVAMSGGVDSSVAALLLHEAGESIVGLSLQLHDRTADGGGAWGRCCSPGDFLDARRVADRLGAPFYVLNMEREFRDDVIADFVAAYREGRTPVPCARCNTGPKFRHLADRARALGADRVATGHYARVGTDPATGRRVLRRARDRAKDQSYFLYDLSQEQLAMSLFPIGDLEKDEVRRIAAAGGLPNAGKPESQDICFVPDGDYRGFLRRVGAMEDRPGAITDRRGVVVGRHRGIADFTVGQRRGLGLAAGRPRYVVELDPVANRVVVGDAGDQYGDRLVAGRARWVSIDTPRSSFEAEIRIRSTHAGARARIEPIGPDRFRAVFREPQRAIAPGQAAVLYDGDLLLGGGTIERAAATAAGV